MKKLKHLFCIALAAVVTVTSLVTTPIEAKADGDTIITVPITVQEEYSMANEFFQIMNQKRVEAGLPEYKLDAGLMDMAMTRAAQLCIYFDHKSLYSNNQAVSDLRTGTPIEYTVGVNEDISDGTADADSTYRVWYGSTGHRPALISTDYNYCGIGVVTYHNNIKWSLIVSKYPCGNEIESVSGSKTNTRNIDAKAKFFSRSIYRTINADERTIDLDANGKTEDSFTFSDIGSKSCSYYVTQPGIFIFKSNNPELFDVDGVGRITPKANGTGSMTVYYKGSVELLTVPVKAGLMPKPTKTPEPGTINPVTPTPAQPDQIEPVTPSGNPDAGNTETPSQPTETLSQPTETPSQPTETPSQPTVPSQQETSTPSTQETTVSPAKPTEQPNNSKQTEIKLTVKVSNVTYNGKARKPSVKVYSGKKRLSSKYYTVSYKNNKNVGYGTVTVKGKGNYSKASGTAKFKINLKKTKLSVAKSTKKKTFITTWKKTGGNSGWQVQYSTNKKFRSGVRTVNLKSRNTKLTVRKLRSRKTYYIRVRGYKKVKGKIMYAGWSNVKKVKVK